MQNIPVFYHIPKCGGTFFWDHTLAYSMDRQNPDRNKYGLGFFKIKNHNNIFKAACYIEKEYLNNFLNQTITIDIFEKHFTNNRFLLYAFCIISDSKFLDTKKYIDELADKNSFDPIYVTILRNPIDRLQSIFYYNTEFGEWEKNYQTISQNTFHDYIYSNNLESNWIINHINQNGDIYPDETHLECAIDILDSFAVVGTLEKINEFELSIKKYNIEYRPINSKFYREHMSIEKAMNKNTKSKKRDISQEDIRHLQEKCKYDIALYNYFNHHH